MLHKIAKMINQYLTSAAKRHELDIAANDFHVEITVTAKTSGGQVIAITNDITVKDGLPTVYSETIRNEFGAVLKFVPGRAGNGASAKKKEMDSLVASWNGSTSDGAASLAKHWDDVTAALASANKNLETSAVDLGSKIDAALSGTMNVIAIDDLADFVETVPAKKTRKKKAADAQEQ